MVAIREMVLGLDSKIIKQVHQIVDKLSLAFVPWVS